MKTIELNNNEINLLHGSIIARIAIINNLISNIFNTDKDKYRRNRYKEDIATLIELQERITR